MVNFIHIYDDSTVINRVFPIPSCIKLYNKIISRSHLSEFHIHSTSLVCHYTDIVCIIMLYEIDSIHMIITCFSNKDLYNIFTITKYTASFIQKKVMLLFCRISPGYKEISSWGGKLFSRMFRYECIHGYSSDNINEGAIMFFIYMDNYQKRDILLDRDRDYGCSARRNCRLQESVLYVFCKYLLGYTHFRDQSQRLHLGWYYYCEQS